MFDKLFKRERNLDQVVAELIESWDDEFKASEVIKKLDQFDKAKVAKQLESVILLPELPATKICDQVVQAYVHFGGEKRGRALNLLS